MGHSDLGPAVMAAMLGSLGLFSVDEYPRMFLLVESHVPTLYYEAMIQVLRRAKMGGVKVQMLYFTEPADAFTFARERLLPEIDPGHGFGDVTDPDIGGVLVGVVE